MNKILIVAAHPDDEVLGCGGLIAKRRHASSVKVIFLAEGSSCRYPPGEVGGAPVLEDIATRTACARRALSLLGVEDVVFCDHPCGRLDRVPIIDINKAIESELARYQPDTVLTHSENDVNNDHRIVYRSVLMATRPGGLHHVPNLLSFEVQSSTEWNFSAPFAPNHFEVLSAADLALKWQALACYDTETRQYPHPRSREGVETLARYRGMQAGTDYAEAYHIIRMIAK